MTPTYTPCLPLASLLLALPSLSGCSGGATPVDASRSLQAPQPALLELTLVSADIQGHMANGEHWDRDGQKSDVTPPAMANYLAQHPELVDTQDTVGLPLQDPELAERASESKAADPVVLLEIGDQVFRSPVRPRAFNPIWDFPLHVVARDPATESVRIHVLDYDGPGKYDAIGSTVVSVEQLLAQPVHTLPAFGAVDKLILQARSLPPNPEVTNQGTRLAVPGKPTWTDTGIRVIAGQQVHITAADEVCTTLDDPDDCSGPEGQSAPKDPNVPGFSDLGHGALIAVLGDTRFHVGRELKFVAPASGILRLGINDTHSINNKGAYAVHVVVRPPAGAPAPAQETP